MKKLLLLACIMALAAGTALAQDPSSFRNVRPDPITPPTPKPISDLATRDDEPARPVPEPGTMALASMGLIALGAAARGRRKQ